MSDPVEHLTQFVIPVQRWSDGTEAAKPNCAEGGQAPVNNAAT